MSFTPFISAIGRNATQRRIALLAAAASLAIAVGAPGCRTLRQHKVTPDSVAQCRQLSREGVAAMERGESDQARQLLDRAVAASPGDLDARRELGEVLWQEGARQEAMVHIEAAVRLDPKHAPTVVRSGEMLLELGAVDRALARAEEAVELDPSLGDAWALRGRVFQRRGEFDRALADLQQALRFSPHDAGVLIQTAELQYQLQRPQRCLATLHQLLEAYPLGERPRRALWLEGLAYAQVDRREDAVASLLAASQRGDPDPQLLSQLAQAQSVAGRPLEAAETARRALAVDASHGPSRAILTEAEAQIAAKTPAGVRR